MSTTVTRRASSVPPLHRWHALDQDALFETDSTKMTDKITIAEKAILVRMKELFGATGDHIEEDLILDDALYALRALRNCVMHGALVA